MSTLIPLLYIIILQAVFPSCYSKNKSFTFYHFMKRPPNFRRIYGGSTFELEDSPFVVAILGFDQKERCTATALSSRWCLTAAHCFLAETDEDWRFVRYNTDWTREGGNITAIEKAYWHPRFQYIKYQPTIYIQADILVVQNDIGMVYTADEMIMNTDKPFPQIADYEEPTPKLYERLMNQKAEVYGFSYPEEPKGAQLMSFEATLNATTYGMVYQECVSGFANGSAICKGDSGGPVFVDDVIVAITCLSQSYCVGKEDEVGESIMTLVHPYEDRINGMVENISNPFPWLLQIPEGGAGASSLLPFTFAMFLISVVSFLLN